MKKLILIIPIIFSLTIISCQRIEPHKEKLQVHYENLEPQEIEIKNYADALFSIDTLNFTEGLKSIQEEYHIFLDGNIDDPNAVGFLKSFATDTFCIRLNDIAKNKFIDTKKLNKEIKSVCQHFKYYYPNIDIPNTAYLYISGIDYEMPAIMILDDGIVISMDFYLGNDNKIYDYIGMPRFRSLRCQPDYISRDLAQSFYSTFIDKTNHQKDVMSEMINAGKRLYFIEAMNPSLPDSILMGYSSKQMQWAQLYESDVWASVVGNNMLYSNEVEVFRTLFGDGPFTQAFSNEAPSRLGEFVGLQIIRSYMNNNDVSLQDLMNNNDLQQIFQESQYKPK